VALADQRAAVAILLAERRSATFQRRKILLVSTPKTKGLSRIQREYEASDQRRFFVPCRTAMSTRRWSSRISAGVLRLARPPLCAPPSRPASPPSRSRRAGERAGDYWSCAHPYTGPEVKS
jgi:phage terminase large subunit GpA-like protein